MKRMPLKGTKIRHLKPGSLIFLENHQNGDDIIIAIILENGIRFRGKSFDLKSQYSWYWEAFDYNPHWNILFNPK